MITTVRDLMRPALFTCPPFVTLGEAAALLTRYGVHALIVAGPDGHPLGVLSDTDLLAGEWLSADPDALATMRAMTAGQLMSAPVEAIDADAPASEAARKMAELAAQSGASLVSQENTQETLEDVFLRTVKGESIPQKPVDSVGTADGPADGK